MVFFFYVHFVFVCEFRLSLSFNLSPNTPPTLIKKKKFVVMNVVVRFTLSVMLRRQINVT